MEQTRYYFAYGANMDEAQMRRRCRGATFIEVGRLEGYRFVINRRGVATVVPDTSGEVHGVLWTITQSDERALDRYEDVEEGTYGKRQVDVILGSGGTVSAMAYVAADSLPGRPRGGYLHRMIAAAERWGFPEAYVTELRTWLRPRD